MFEKIVDLIAGGGYWGIAALMALENIFPPIPSELIMPFAGFAAARGELTLGGVLLAGMLGSLAGAVPWYFAGRLIGHERLSHLADRHGRWLTMTAADIDKSLATFARHGRKLVLFGRMVPAIRTLISIPAGMAGMQFLPFLMFSAIGSFAWGALLATIGFMLEERYTVVAQYLDPLTKLIVASIVCTYAYRFATFESRKR